MPMIDPFAGDMPVLDAPRVRLRALRDADIPALFDVFGDPETMRYWSWPALPALDDAARLLQRIHDGFRARTFLQWGIADRQTDTVIGTCTLFRLDLDHRRAEIGFALARTTWGRGLASEAVRAVLRFAFDELGLHRVEADADPRNARSLALLERLGFRREGLLRERYHVAGEIQDAVLLGLLAPEWRARLATEATGDALR